MRGVNYLLGSLVLVICVNEYLSVVSPPLPPNPEATDNTKTQCTNASDISLVIPTVHNYPEENVTVSTVRSRSVLGVQMLTELINNKEVKSLLINKTTVVNIETKNISPTSIHIKTTNSISPTVIRVLIGSGEPEILNNQTNPVTTTTETTTPNAENSTPDSYCSQAAESNTTTETWAIAGNTCSKVTAASASTTITTSEKVIVLGPNGSSDSCTYY